MVSTPRLGRRARAGARDRGRGGFNAEETGALGAQFGPIRSVVVLAHRIVDLAQMVHFHLASDDDEDPRTAASFGDARDADIAGARAAGHALRMGQPRPSDRATPRACTRLAGQLPQRRVAAGLRAVTADRRALGSPSLLPARERTKERATPVGDPLPASPLVRETGCVSALAPRRSSLPLGRIFHAAAVACARRKPHRRRGQA